MSVLRMCWLRSPVRRSWQPSWSIFVAFLLKTTPPAVLSKLTQEQNLRTPQIMILLLKSSHDPTSWAYSAITVSWNAIIDEVLRYLHCEGDRVGQIWEVEHVREIVEKHLVLLRERLLWVEVLALDLWLLAKDGGVLWQRLVELHHIMVVVEWRGLLLRRLVVAWDVGLLHLQGSTPAE